ncbi:MAG: hypothetical protein ABJA20_14975 [Novosphingobium sp.]
MMQPVVATVTVTRSRVNPIIALLGTSLFFSSCALLAHKTESDCGNIFEYNNAKFILNKSKIMYSNNNYIESYYLIKKWNSKSHSKYFYIQKNIIIVDKNYETADMFFQMKEFREAAAINIDSLNRSILNYDAFPMRCWRRLKPKPQSRE